MERFSTGRLLLEKLIEFAYGKNLKIFDLTIGSEGYKKWLDKEEPLFRMIKPITLKGKICNFLFKIFNRFKTTSLYNYLKHYYKKLKYCRMNEKFFYINRNKLELKLLVYILFFVSAFSVFISILLVGIFNLKITFYEYSYFLTVIISVYIFFNNYIFSLMLNRLIFNLLFYFFLISIPITYFTGSLISSLFF